MPSTLGIVASQVIPATLIPTTGLVLWLASDDDSTFSYRTSYYVSQWRDKSNGGHHFTPLYATREARRNGVLNGKPTVYFEGTTVQIEGNGGFMQAASWPTVPLDNTTMFSVARTQTQPNGSTRPHVCNGSVGLTHNGATSQLGALHENVAWIGAGPPDLNNWILEGYIRAAGSAQIRKNRAALGSPSTAGVNAPGGAVASLGGDGWGDAAMVRCDIAEYLIYNRVLTAPEITQVESYLSTKWGTP